MNYLLLIIGFILLIKGADFFVDGASTLSKKIGIPSIIVGLTIVSIGTSAPELAVSIMSAIKGNSDISMGNIIGSNIFNILAVLGCTSMVSPILIKKKEIKRDYMATILSTILLIVLAFFASINNSNNTITRLEGGILLVACTIYTIILIKSALKNSDKNTNNSAENISMSTLKCLLFLLIGIFGIIFGGNMVVESASIIAIDLGMSDKLVGLTIVAIGTSLPELVTSIVAAKKGENEIALGNILGSCIFNVLLIIGVVATITPIAIASSLLVDSLFLAIIILLLGVIIFINKKEEVLLAKYAGLLFVGVYISYSIYIIIRN